MRHTTTVPQHVIIDGNNLLHAMHAHAPIPHVGRETLVKIIERWAKTGTDEVTLVFDGATPRGGFAKQMASPRIDVKFSAPETADDIIVRMVHQSRKPHTIRVVSTDTAIRHEAHMRRCMHIKSAGFVAELFPTPGASSPGKPTDPARSASSQEPPGPEKPISLTPEETDEWLDVFGVKEDPEPFDKLDGFDGFDAMMD